MAGKRIPQTVMNFCCIEDFEHEHVQSNAVQEVADKMLSDIRSGMKKIFSLVYIPSVPARNNFVPIVDCKEFHRGLAPHEIDTPFTNNAVNGFDCASISRFVGILPNSVPAHLFDAMLAMSAVGPVSSSKGELDHDTLIRENVDAAALIRCVSSHFVYVRTNALDNVHACLDDLNGFMKEAIERDTGLSESLNALEESISKMKSMGGDMPLLFGGATTRSKIILCTENSDSTRFLDALETMKMDSAPRSASEEDADDDEKQSDATLCLLVIDVSSPTLSEFLRLRAFGSVQSTKSFYTSAILTQVKCLALINNLNLATFVCKLIQAKPQRVQTAGEITITADALLHEKMLVDAKAGNFVDNDFAFPAVCSLCYPTQPLRDSQGTLIFARNVGICPQFTREPRIYGVGDGYILFDVRPQILEEIFSRDDTGAMRAASRSIRVTKENYKATCIDVDAPVLGMGLFINTPDAVVKTMKRVCREQKNGDYFKRFFSAYASTLGSAPWVDPCFTSRIFIDCDYRVASKLVRNLISWHSIDRRYVQPRMFTHLLFEYAGPPPLAFTRMCYPTFRMQWLGLTSSSDDLQIAAREEWITIQRSHLVVTMSFFMLQQDMLPDVHSIADLFHDEDPQGKTVRIRRKHIEAAAVRCKQMPSGAHKQWSTLLRFRGASGEISM